MRNVQEGAEHAANRLREGFETGRDEFARRYRRAEGVVARNPTSSVLMGFGLGFGLGFALTVLLTREEESWADRYMPDSLRNLPDSLQRMRKRMPNSMQEMGIADSFQHLTESIRDLPSAIAKMVPGR
jgi:hypothetical protein